MNMSSSNERDEIVTVQLPCDTVLEDEPLAILRTIAADYKFFDFYLRIGREQHIQLAGGRLWPSMIIDGVIRTIPSFYIYLIAVTKCENGDRYMTIGVVHWLFGIYAELEITYRIYPELFFKTRPLEYNVIPLYLPSVTFNSTGYYIDYTGQEQLTVSEAKDMVSGAVDTLITYINENQNTDY
ncbi:Hypothetical predicted protein [Paramuricea clavata]|uniref:Uncharacterized protein n=1 Tax=Paramuricea clavata TaxID=317549 RepID=A0A6S7FM63_PARCT|nr:Hypothetical predicted protein [Paramuricea clavata]